MQNFFIHMNVAPDGTCHTWSHWDEGGKKFGVYKDGDVIGATRIDRWTTDRDAQAIAVHSQRYAPPCILDGFGETLAVLPFPEAVEKPGGGPGGRDVYGAYMLHHIDCYGDAREEIILVNHRALCVWTNAAGSAPASPPAWRSDLGRQPPRLYDHTVYTGRG